MSQYGRGGHPASQANLVSHRFQPGHDPKRNPGRPIGQSIVEALNQLDAADAEGDAIYDLPKLKELAGHDKTRPSLAYAARLLVDAREGGFDKIDRHPKALASMREIMDRTIGKPAVTVEHTHRTKLSWDDLSAALADTPDVRQRLRATLDKLDGIGQPELPAVVEATGDGSN